LISAGFQWTGSTPAGFQAAFRAAYSSCMGWLRLVGSIRLQVSFAEYSLFYRALWQNRPIILSILLTEATPYPYLFCQKSPRIPLPQAEEVGSQIITTAKISTNFHRSPRTYQTSFLRSSKISNWFSVEYTESPSLKRESRKTGLSGDPNILSLTSSVSGESNLRISYSIERALHSY